MIRCFAALRQPGVHRRYVGWHAVVLPGMFALLGPALHWSGADFALSRLWFDSASGQFVGQDVRWLELLGHRLAKSAVLALWGLLLVAAVAARWWPAWRPHRGVLWRTVLAMALGPAVVAGLKDINTAACPWSLVEFGGSAVYHLDWFVSRAEAGRCFPGGHAAGGFSLIALAFAGRLTGHPRLERWGLWAALLVGGLFSGVRMLQGAHFASHNLWSAALDWWLAMLVFAPALCAHTTPAIAPMPSPTDLKTI